MSDNESTSTTRRTPWGLAAKLRVSLIVLGAVAVFVSSLLGYFRARDAPEKSIYDQLTSARLAKARQVETYFRTVRAELSLLATSKMVVDATREFRTVVEQLDREESASELREKVGS